MQSLASPSTASLLLIPMASTKVQSTFQLRYGKYLIILGLATSGLLPGILPVLADGTQAGETISNTATATYADPNNPNTPINTTSNTVTVTVAEIAGITVTSSGNDFQPGGDIDNDAQVTAGDQIYASYTITNVGNDPTTFRIPNLATVSGPASVVGNLEVSEDGGTTWTPIIGTELITPSKSPGESILVRVPVTVTTSAQPGQAINVKLGDTLADAQNQPRNPSGGDVYTVDSPDGSPDEIDGAPANGTREASASQEITVGTSLKSYTLATVLKVRSGYSDSNTPAILSDDTLTYDLSLQVENNDPTELTITPAPLVGSALTLAAGTVITAPANNYVLVSDAIPTGTDLASVGTAPTGWTPVYTTDAVTIDANAAAWTETAPPNLADVTRVGFVYDTTTRGAIAIGEVITGFSITLNVEPSFAGTSLTVANIAQTFGASPSGAPVYDESGDQSPSNFGNNTSASALPPGTTDANGDGVPDPGSPLDPNGVDDGFIDTPATPETGTDPGNNNTGDDPNPTEGGEANVFVIEPPANAEIGNGPANAPEATGPDGTDETDFTNQSALVPSGTAPGSTLDPAPVGFTNTVENTGSDAGDITLEPQAPANPGDLPPNTTVTITEGSNSATYSWNGSIFTTTDPPVTVASVPSGGIVNYGVEINLPPGTPLSTDGAGADPTDPNAPAIGGFPVPILASINTDGNPGAEATNLTIDRVYTGYLRLAKESRILQGSGPAVIAGEETFSTAAKSPSTGNIIEYRITYQNITEPQSGVGNVILDAANIVITENGTSGNNNWALDNDANTVIDTSNVPGSAGDTQSGTITFTPSGDQNGTTAATDVTEYVDTIPGVLAPQDAGEFTFQRQLN